MSVADYVKANESVRMRYYPYLEIMYLMANMAGGRNREKKNAD